MRYFKKFIKNIKKSTDGVGKKIHGQQEEKKKTILREAGKSDEAAS